MYDNARIFEGTVNNYIKAIRLSESYALQLTGIRQLLPQSLEKVEFTLAFRQPQPPTNLCFLRVNDCTYAYETYYNACLHTLRRSELSFPAVIGGSHFVAEEQWVGKEWVFLVKHDASLCAKP